MQSVQIKSALISVYYKDRLEPLVELLKQQNVTIYSTGGTQAFLEEQGANVVAVEDLTNYPSIFGGRVKTLHPKVFGGILHRRENAGDLSEREQYEIPPIDLVVVDLYPFEETVASGASEADVIEKIDIGGISLIRAAAKNFKDVLIVSSRDQYGEVVELLQAKNGATDMEDRKRFAAKAFDISSHYDTHIFSYLNESEDVFKQSVRAATPLRYGENPHQKGTFYGNLEDLFEQLNGKQLSYNNLVDVDAAVALAAEFDETVVAILKHTNACGCATGDSVKEAYLNALSSDPVSAFGGVIITNKTVDLAAAEELNKLFFEVLIAPDFDEDALELLKTKKNRILLKQKPVELPTKLFKTLLNGVIEQDKDLATETEADFKTVTKREPTSEEKKALVFAAKVCKHTKSNTIVLATDKMMFSSGVGQTSRVDALRQAIEKAKSFGFDVSQTVMASDAFFPFPDCVEIADQAGIKAVVQPGGSIKDKDSIDYCDAHNMAMVMTGVRHFKH
ncbi:phosphoribosylaminoimidazolecarboxamide formyltransferase/IMP cyclohydrolase [Pontibacter ummariensis]|uniref:Bifunctional purine biosynthesis protein PurH n=1 Tax=Pontibacter ummariensis TaxID=1610492 RepID=A0A239HGE7_9BACT|nr:bifunctional phosphoribosylaminoimidazolecarboxamide formyltransferase/IMP cyclohydrolase [Pontibacter ummariensis]PRY10593.1 phosphoribosylaminoimidazolecarboxamide formyltransferase/IMP cyclohydrolase [Pontibacter ummariensis]SNS80437.1 phosphoribosylaminoimidazolecarboxamide formyltransferase / IMP cyclohydrolase [Pontibacter ummariensis]